MFSMLRSKFTFANVAMAFALVFAMAGGAYAAGKYVITSTKQIKPSVLKQLQGKAGPAGAPGLQGPAGPAGPQGVAGSKGENGAAGSNGTNGKDGTNGESVTVTEFPGEKGKCKAGGSEFKVGSGKASYACNGSIGETLPSGQSETGIWVVAPQPALESGLYGTSGSISFTVPLKNAPTAHFIGLKEGAEESEEKLPAGCTGNFTRPGAEPGNLCVFMKQGPSKEALKKEEFIIQLKSPSTAGGPEGEAGKLGTIVDVLAGTSNAIIADGDWVVSAQ